MSTLTREEALSEALGRDWYHTIELAPGQATKGFVDLRDHAPHVLPADLSGKRVLDVGTFDGFWAFELEKRGAAEVVATDLDDHRDTDWSLIFREQLQKELDESGHVVPGERFALAAKALDSKVTRVPSNIYDLEPERLGGPVDLAFIGALLLHLRDPARGLEAVRSTLVPGGRILLFEPFLRRPRLLGSSRPLAELRGARFQRDWWFLNIPGLKALLELSGFEQIEKIGRTRMVKSGGGYSMVHVALTAVARQDL